MYAIRNLCPRLDNDMGGHGFNVDLTDKWPAAIKASGITQERVNAFVADNSDRWLRSCGYRAEIYSPFSIHVAWGEWGPEHINVPGNACGLDIDRHSFLCIFPNGKVLLPHNVDCWRQVQLILVVFTEIADLVITLGREAW